MNLAEQVKKMIESDCRELFLAYLAFELTVAARDAYVEVGRTPDTSSKMLRCHNELQHSISAQLRDYLTGKPGYPDDVFARMLVEKSQSFGNCDRQLQWAVDRAASLIGSTERSSV